MKELKERESFYDWFTRLIEEKELDMSEFCTDGIQVGDVCQAICDAPASEQEKVKNILIMLDFNNKDMLHFFNYLALKLDKKDIQKRRSEMAEEMFNYMLNECREEKKKNRNTKKGGGK